MIFVNLVREGVSRDQGSECWGKWDLKGIHARTLRDGSSDGRIVAQGILGHPHLHMQ